MATYSNNTTIKIGSTVTFYRNVFATNVSDSYTVPANCYLVVHFAAFGGSSGGSATITYQYPGLPVQTLSGGIPTDFEYSTDTSPPGVVAANPFAKTFPAGTVFSLQANAAGAPFFQASYSFAAQLFQNTP
jgi:hypothetical protein